MARLSRIYTTMCLHITKMQTYVFVAMVIVVLLPLGFLLLNRKQAAFTREIIKVEEAHLVIAQNLASTLDRYAGDLKATFEFIVLNGNVELDPTSLDALFRFYGISLVAELGTSGDTHKVIYSHSLGRPPAHVVAQLRNMSPIHP